ncbi:hypothetical protein PYW07_015208 [Mythimna separata]|uniref:Gustatory receptor n=1 Tax=Mythimna separata TaxID=271217 RepID=A0AAD7YXB4_MYTSE|nr:hypothetical protein PYW07_015208 [Mythimna separata]
MGKYFKTTMKKREYKNIIEALESSNIIRKLSGISIFVLKIDPDNRITRKFCVYGMLGFLIWFALFLYCTIQAHAENQTVLRILYNTKVQRYGDDYERISATLYVLFALWKIPYSLNTNNQFIEIVVKVDKALEALGEDVDYTQDAHLALILSIFQLTVNLFRLLSIWTSFNRLNLLVPLERLYQVVYSDALAFIAAAHYFFYLKVVRGRYERINKVLEEIKNHKSWEYKLFSRTNTVGSVHKAIGLQDKYVCEKIQACAKMYGMLYQVTDAINIMFGTILTATIFVSLNDIIIYMFYFMEATAARLFYDVEKYVVFLIYVAWQMAYGISIIYFIVYVSERAVCAAQNASFVVHEIMNIDFNPAVKAEAMQLSIQVLHQKPVYTAHGLYVLSYPLLYQFTQAVYTSLIILLQFVADTTPPDLLLSTPK